MLGSMSPAVCILGACLAVAATALNSDAKRWDNTDTAWANQWQPDGEPLSFIIRLSKDWQSPDAVMIANGVVHHGYNSTFGQGYSNATQIRVAYRGCEGMSISFSTNDRQSAPQVLYGLSKSSLVSVPFLGKDLV